VRYALFGKTVIYEGFLQQYLPGTDLKVHTCANGVPSGM
jgi:hypothetical protein